MMMNWDGNWAWGWLMMVPMMLLIWATIALLVLPWMRTERDLPLSPIGQLDHRLAAGEINVEEYRARREELEHRSPV